MWEGKQSSQAELGKKKLRSHRGVVFTCGLFTHFINNDCK